MTRAEFYDSLWKVSEYTVNYTIFAPLPQYQEDASLAHKKLVETIEELMAEWDAKTARIVELENEIELMRHAWPVVTPTQIETRASVLERKNNDNECCSA